MTWNTKPKRSTPGWSLSITTLAWIPDSPTHLNGFKYGRLLRPTFWAGRYPLQLLGRVHEKARGLSQEPRRALTHRETRVAIIHHKGVLGLRAVPGCEPLLSRGVLCTAFLQLVVVCNRYLESFRCREIAKWPGPRQPRPIKIRCGRGIIQPTENHNSH